jgi:hypothetical protein
MPLSALYTNGLRLSDTSQIEIRATVISVEILSKELDQPAVCQWMKRGTNRADAHTLIRIFFLFFLYRRHCGVSNFNKLGDTCVA